MTVRSQVCQLTARSSFQIGFLIPFFKAKKRQNVSLAYICGDFVQVHYRGNTSYSRYSEFTYIFACYCSC